MLAKIYLIARYGIKDKYTIKYPLIVFTIWLHLKTPLNLFSGANIQL